MPKRVTLAQRQDQLQLPGVQHVGDLVQVRQPVQPRALHHRRQRDRDALAHEGPHARHDLVVVPAYPAEDGPGAVEPDVRECDLPASFGAVSTPRVAFVGQPDDEPREHVHDVDQVAAQERLPARQEYAVHAREVVPDRLQLRESRIRELKGLRAEHAPEVAPFSHLHDDRQRRCGGAGQRTWVGSPGGREVVPAGEGDTFGNGALLLGSIAGIPSAVELVIVISGLAKGNGRRLPVSGRYGGSSSSMLRSFRSRMAAAREQRKPESRWLASSPLPEAAHAHG